MASEIKVNKISPATGTALQISDSGDTTTIPSGATVTAAGTINVTGTIIILEQLQDLVQLIGKQEILKLRLLQVLQAKVIL